MNIPPVNPVATPDVAANPAASRPEGAPDFALNDTTDQPNQVGEFLSKFEAPFHAHTESFERLRSEMNELTTRDAEFKNRPGFRADDPDYQAFMQERSAKLLSLQLEVQQVAFGVETAAKVIEHATSGARTVLQTQT